MRNASPLITSHASELPTDHSASAYGSGGKGTYSGAREGSTVDAVDERTAAA